MTDPGALLPHRAPGGGAPAPRASARGVLEVALTFLKLGCLSFGGPVAHVGYFRAELVERRRWLDDAHYADLVALCQFLPGPGSSQVVFALGMHRAGFFGALSASACFTLPSALLMIAFAYGVAAFGDLHGAGWLHGLKLAAVAVVAQAVWGMGQKLCLDKARGSHCLLSAAVLLAVPGALTQVGVIAAGGLAGFWLYRKAKAPSAAPSNPRDHHALAATALVLFAALLVALPALTAATGSRLVQPRLHRGRARAVGRGGGAPRLRPAGAVEGAALAGGAGRGRGGSVGAARVSGLRRPLQSSGSGMISSASSPSSASSGSSSTWAPVAGRSLDPTTYHCRPC